MLAHGEPKRAGHRRHRLLLRLLRRRRRRRGGGAAAMGFDVVAAVGDAPPCPRPPPRTYSWRGGDPPRVVSSPPRRAVFTPGMVQHGARLPRRDTLIFSRHRRALCGAAAAASGDVFPVVSDEGRPRRRRRARRACARRRARHAPPRPSAEDAHPDVSCAASALASVHTPWRCLCFGTLSHTTYRRPLRLTILHASHRQLDRGSNLERTGEGGGGGW